MAFYNSPRVASFEIDATLGTPETGDAKAGLAGVAAWGPADKPTYMTGGEKEFARRFGKPNNETFLDFFVAADYTSYVSKLVFVRVVGQNSRNAVSDNMVPILVKNDEDLQTANLFGYNFIGKYPGSAANGLRVSIADKATFANWEYNSSFPYEPEDGEFNVAVVDGGGYWTGNGAVQQVERIGVSGTVVAGIQQQQTVTFVGTASGGTRQEETLTVLGGTNSNIQPFTLTVDGNDVALSASMTERDVAEAIGTVMTANSLRYQSVEVTDNRIKVVFAIPATQTMIQPVAGGGTSVSSFVNKIGNPKFILNVYGKELVMTYGDASTVAARAFYEALKRDDRTYKNVEMATINAVQYTFVQNGAQTTVPSQVSSGYTITTVVDVTGDDKGTITVMGIPVNVINGDTALIVVGKIKDAFIADSGMTAKYDLIRTDKTTVQMRRKDVGFYALGDVGQNSQLGLYIDLDMFQPGSRGEILERYNLLRQVPGSKNADGTTTYFFDAINNGSNVVAVADKNFVLKAGDWVLSGGVDDNANVSRIPGINQLRSSDSLELEYILTGPAVVAEQKIAVDIAETRKDVVTFVAPPLSALVGNNGNQVADIKTWKTVNLNRDSSYGVAVDNWGYVYDQYNDTYRWIPATGGTAGLYARTARDQDPWISPAGHERGRYKNYIKTAWNSSQDDRDELYKVGVNSIVTFLNEGIVLYGDKTMTTRPSAFSHTNVRFAFISAEKGIADLAKRFLFEVNDEFTRAQFLNAIRPFLRNMTNRRAFEDFRVICDESNNGPEVRAQNRAVAHIFLKPLYSINFIDLYFVAVRPDVTFEEVEGQLIN
ncbi:phage tail sheath protein [Ralstonia phage RSP15]|uniref:tail sheath n=1 Tax=Ralstonia phage RSP15 TaxID=1785960 RepID=UPI00074D42E1|nr:tail sheath [Ralstonia phage RSP15]BAU39995.1 phage tail sheath protein [Ralstonia phage RSP15]